MPYYSYHSVNYNLFKQFMVYIKYIEETIKTMYGVLPMKLMYYTEQPKDNRISFKLKMVLTELYLTNTQ